MIGRIEFNFQDGITRYFDENENEIDADAAKQLIAEREQFLAEQASNPPAVVVEQSTSTSTDEPSEG